jgi:hypothetical protein
VIASVDYILSALIVRCFLTSVSLIWQKPQFVQFCSISVIMTGMSVYTRLYHTQVNLCLLIKQIWNNTDKKKDTNHLQAQFEQTEMFADFNNLEMEKKDANTVKMRHFNS